MERVGFFIDGKFGEGPEAVSVRDPWSGEAIAEGGAAGRSDVERATASALGAFARTRDSSRAARAEILARAADGLGRRAEEIAGKIRLEAGKPISLARWEVVRARNTLQLAAEEAKRFTGELLAADILPRYEGYRALYERFPIGPILGITPFNFPLSLVAHKIAPAVATGNPVLVKPAPQTPLTALALAEILHEAGAPPGSVNVVPCSNELAEEMVRDERHRMLSFTGGVRAGWYLKSISGKKKVTLELGGNAGLIVAPDADLESAARKAAVGAFAYAGQACISVQRIFVARSIYGAFLERFRAEAEALGVGDPADEKTAVGPLVNAATADRVMSWLDEARHAGARILSGGTRRGNVIDPTIVVDVKPSMRISCEEVFGPVATVEPFDDLARAIAAVNDSPFGLQAGVFTYDTRTIDYAFRNLDVGAVLVNETSYFRIDNYPYGGVKDSGFGREGVRYAMESMTEPRVLVAAPG